MSELPFLVVHGALVWKAGVVATGAFGVKAGRWRRNRKSSNFVRRATQHYTATATGLEPGPILLRGVLRGGGARSFEQGTLPVIHARDEGAYLDIEGERIDFDGEIVVGCGTENRTAYWRRIADAPPSTDPLATRRGPQRLSVVRDGDEVLVGGVLKRAAADGDAAYRDSAGGWKIEPYPRQGAIGVVAKAHRAVALPVGPVRTSVTFGWVGLTMLLGMTMCGAIESHPYGSVTRRVHALTIASAMPASRADALADLEAVWLQDRTPANLDKAIELRELRRGCAAAVDLMFEESRPEDARAAAARCDLPAQEATALIVLGRYDELAAAPSLLAAATPEQRDLVAIAAGRWADAHATTELGDCAADLYTALAAPGQPAPPRLKTGSARCELLGSQLLATADQRGAAAYEITTETDADAQLQVALLDLSMKTGVRRAGDLGRAGLDLATDAADPSVWTSRPGDLTPARAVYEVYRGNFDKAQAIAGSLVTNGRGAVLLEAQRLAALIAIRAGRPVSPAWLQKDDELSDDSAYRRPELAQVLTLASSDPVGEIETRLGAVHVDRPGNSLQTFDDLVSGEGDAFRDYYGDRMGIADAVSLLAALPHVTRHRDIVLGYLAALFGPDLRDQTSPLQMIRTAALRRDLARAAGDDAAAKSWQSVVDRQLAMIEKPNRLLALLAR